MIYKLPWATKWRQLLERMEHVFFGAVTNSRMRGMRHTTCSRLPHASTVSNISNLGEEACGKKEVRLVVAERAVVFARAPCEHPSA